MGGENTTHSKTKYLAKNVALLSVSNFGSKFLIILLVPLYTYVLTTEEYGTYDIIYNTIGLLVPIFTCNIADGVMRFAMDDSADRSKIIRAGLLFVTVGTTVTSILLLWKSMPWSPFFDKYIVYIPPFFFSTALYTLLTQFCRGCEKVLDVAIAGIVCTVVMLTGNIVMLLVWHMGLDGFFIANIASQFIPSLWLLFRIRRIVFSNEPGCESDLKAMLLYALPLMTSTLGWWFVSVSDRYIVTYFCGLAEDGLYSVAYKIPAILNVVQVVFIQAWQISAVKEFDDHDKDGFFSQTYTSVETIMFIACAVMMPLIPLIASVLFQNEFYEAWKYVPFLLVYVVFNVASGIWGGLFSAKKDAFSMAVSMLAGAVLNVAAGIPLVFLFGVQGAAVSTLLAGALIWVIRAVRIRKHVRTNFHFFLSVICYMILIAQGCVMLLHIADSLCIAIEVILILAILILRWKSIGSISKMLIDYISLLGRRHG